MLLNLKECFSYLPDVEATGISLSSQDLQRGNVFIAVQGTQSNAKHGLDFLSSVNMDHVVLLICAPEDRSHEALKNVEAHKIYFFHSPRWLYAQLVNFFYPCHSMENLAVTGTNGKSSVVDFFYQLCQGNRSISVATIGTLGVQGDVSLEQEASSLTTPDAKVLNKILQKLEEKKVDCVVFEASSQGLHQNRLSGKLFKVSGFTNLSQDHLDYHGTMEAYFEAKCSLFEQLTTHGAVLNADSPMYEALLMRCQRKNLTILSYGEKGKDLKLLSRSSHGKGQTIHIEWKGETCVMSLALMGSFQIENFLCALGMFCMYFDVNTLSVLKFHGIKTVLGRFDYGGLSPFQGVMYIDYAHTADGLKRVCQAAREHLQDNGKLYLVFGCGGERDSGKRRDMGRVAQEYADYVFVTDDNPRFEDPAMIRQHILQGCPKACEVPGREQGIVRAAFAICEKDILVIAGKGHETHQLIGDRRISYSDYEVLEKIHTPLWRCQEIRRALPDVEILYISCDFPILGISIDTRTLQGGDLFIALRGENSDGHDYLEEAFSKGASAVLVSDWDYFQKTIHPRVFYVKDTFAALRDLGRYAVSRSCAIRIGITGSVGKTSVKDMLLQSLGEEAYGTRGNFNNHYGLPLTLANLPRHKKYGVFEMGMNHRGEIDALAQQVLPHIGIITSIGYAHMENFSGIEDLVKAKLEICNHIEPGGVILLPAEHEHFEKMRLHAHEKNVGVFTFGNLEKASREWDAQRIGETSEDISVTMFFQTLYETPLVGIELQNYLVSGLCLAYLKKDPKEISHALKKLHAFQCSSGRGNRMYYGGATVIDHSYNASPASMKAMIDEACDQWQKNKRQQETYGIVFLLGDMLELGHFSLKAHQDLAEYLHQRLLSLVGCRVAIDSIGNEMKIFHEALGDSLGDSFQIRHFKNINEFKMNFRVLQDNTYYYCKGSYGSNIHKIVSWFQEMHKK